jgi:cyclic-di-AMP phosphodiesterase PgpH
MTEKIKTSLSNVDHLLRYGMVAGVVILISFLYPSNVKFKYEFQRGQTWRYEDLTAPFDFAIKKPNEEIMEDRSRVARDFTPFYRKNPDLANAKIRDFEAAVEQNRAYLASLPDSIRVSPQRYVSFGNTFLNGIYSRGVIKLAPEHQEKGEDFVINVVQGNVSMKRTIPGFYTVDHAQQLLADSLALLKLYMPPVLIQALNGAISPNILYDAEQSEKLKNQALSNIATTKGVVRQGELIVKKGNVVTEDIFEKLVSYREKFESDVISQKSSIVVYAGYLLLTGLILGTFMMYVNAYRREILQHWNYLSFVMLWLVVFSYLTYLVERAEVLSVYVIPYCIVPVVVRHFFTYRLAFFTHVVVVLIAGFLTAEGFQFIFTQIVAGVVAVLAIADARYWSKFFKSVLFIFLAYSVSLLGLEIIEEGDFMQLDWSMHGWLVLNGVLTLMAFPLIPLMERAFGFTSSISLMELADLNRPLLRELAMKAPGTFQHSFQVGNLAEAAANEIGVNPLLVRTGALYHDIGKMLNPEFFVENQSGSSPHENLTHLESATIIIAHVTEGVRLAKKYRLPKVITRFITTHHGTTKVEYFYKTYLQENPGKEVDPADFTYPGPKPQTKSETVVMLADSIEATARTLKNPTGKDIDDLVDKIIAGKIEKGQLSESKFTFSDLEKCRHVFKKMLRSIHHVRLEYPE